MPVRRLPVLAFAVVVTLAGCTSTSRGSTSTSSPPGTTPTSTSTVPEPPSSSTTAAGDAVPFTTVGCDAADDAFAVLCRVVDLVDTNYLESVDHSDLAAGAVRGIEVIPPSDDPDPVEALVCAIPDDDFVALCEAAAADLGATGAPEADVVARAIQGMLAFGIGDPFSGYLSPEELELLTENQSGAVEGIGALVEALEPSVEGDVLCRLLSETCRLVIVGLLEGSPAEAAGFQVGDVVVAVDGASVVGQTIDAVTLQVRGAAGTEVELAVERAGEDLSITVGRVALDIPVAESRMLADGIGYVQLSTFTDDAGSDVAAELGRLLDAGATTIVLDLQNNPGGSLNAAVAVASQFLEDGLVLRTEMRDDEQRYPVQEGGLATSPDVALLVLVNAGSASASEVVTAALQEAGRATVIGENTFGKNIVQRIFPLPNGGAVKLTIARWITASGADYGRDGITPDIEVEVPVDAGADFLVDEALRIATEGEAP